MIFSKFKNIIVPGRELPAEVILGVDFLKKSQVKINFQDSSASLPSSTGEEIRLSFLTSKELSSHRQSTSLSENSSTNNSGNSLSTRAYSSNFW